MPQQLHIVDAQPTTSDPADEHGQSDDATDTALEPQTPDYYDSAADPPWDDYGRDVGAFLKSLLPELGKADYVDDRRHVHHYKQLGDLRAVDTLNPSETDDVDLAALFVLPDETLVFVGSDPTAKNTTPLFGFSIEPFAPIPAPDSAQDALDLLRPADVRAAFDDGEKPDRQGEWWLLPTRRVPVGTPFRPGVSERPYGPSPLGNHVPREWGMTVSDSDFMRNVRERVDALPESTTTPPEVVRWVHRQHQKVPTPDYAPTWETIQAAAGDILVHGTLRHRENDHYIESLDDTWHTARTHNMDVYTADEFDRVVLD